jgi:hypothetical protein
MKNLSYYLTLFVFFGFLMTSCSSSKAIKCESTITTSKMSYTGTAKDELQSQKNACNKYCLEEDATCEAMYQFWASTLKQQGKHVRSKMKAMYQNKKLLDCVTITCAEKCVKSMGDEFMTKCE